MIGFYSKDAANKGCLSNWFPASSHFYWITPDSKIKKTNIVVPTSEHSLMLQKASVFGDFETFLKITCTDSPKDAKMLGRQVCNFQPEVWDQIKYQACVLACKSKFTSNPRLREFLISTGDEELVECSPTDKIWGIGIGLDNPDWKDKSKWQGKNLLGLALMEVRGLF